MHIMMVEPNGEGGICHYTYCLASALHDSGHAILLATADPYELAFARPRFALAHPYGPSRQRRWLRHALRGTDSRRRGNYLSSDVPERVRPLETLPVQRMLAPLAGLTGKLSRSLAKREYQSGWKTTEKLAAAHQGAVVHVQWLHYPGHDRQWIAALKRSGARVVLTVHNVLPHETSGAIREDSAAAYQAADALVVHYASAVLELSSLGVDPHRVWVIPHGNYLPLQQLVADVDPVAGDPTCARASLGIPLGMPVMLFFGLMRPYKGVEYLLDAFARVLPAHPHARLLLVGRAPEGFTEVRQRICERGLQDAVTLIPRYVSLFEAATCFGASDFVVLPYTSASQSGVVQLANAYARPVVASRVGGIPEAVVHGETGLLVPPCDTDRLADALDALLSDPERCARLGANARSIAQTRFDWRRIAHQTTQMYAQVLDG